ncbi:hypothetical protein KP509_1Z009600 [Ceratopteris richardii]|nr:hypothetical protein KP509_1Z009600 [Ceratopteris richardii]
MFCTAGSTVCMWSIDDRDTLAVVSPSFFRPIAYDVLLDTWSQLPPSPLPSSSAPDHRRQYGMLLPLFAFKPCLHDMMCMLWLSYMLVLPILFFSCFDSLTEALFKKIVVTCGCSQR